MEVSRLESGSICLILSVHLLHVSGGPYPFPNRSLLPKNWQFFSPHAQSNLYILPPFILPLQSLNITAALHLVSGNLGFTLLFFGSHRLLQKVFFQVQPFLNQFNKPSLWFPWAVTKWRNTLEQPAWALGVIRPVSIAP